MTGRSVPEWVGKTPDTKVPDHVRLRIFNAHGGICHISGRRILTSDKWDLDHVIALALWTGDGHGNRESNLAPAIKDKHIEKTKQDVKLKARADRNQKRLLGIKPASKWPKRSMARHRSNTKDIYEDIDNGNG